MDVGRNAKSLEPAAPEHEVGGATALFAPGFFVRWYEEHGRAYRWQEDGVSTFHILLTEMLLRQTRAEQAAAIWQPFVEDYPTPAELVNTRRATGRAVLSQPEPL